MILLYHPTEWACSTIESTHTGLCTELKSSGERLTITGPHIYQYISPTPLTPGKRDFAPFCLAQLVATLVGSTKLLYAGPG